MPARRPRTARTSVPSTFWRRCSTTRTRARAARTVDFRHTVVILTSNIGSQLILAHHGRVDEIRDQLTDPLKQRFPPEFRNRIDDIVIFNALTEQDLESIVKLLLDRSRRRVEAQGLELEVTGAAKKKLVELGYQPEFGARPSRRTLQTELDNRLATLLLDGSTRPGDTIVADVGRDGQLRVALAGTTVNEAASEEA